LKTKEKSTFFTKCLGLYFVLMLCDIFSLAGVGTILKFYAIGLLVVSFFYLQKSIIVLDSTFVSQLAYIAMCLFSLFYSISFKASLSALITLLMNYGLVILCQSIKFSEFEVKLLQKSLVCGGILVLIASLFFADFSEGGRLTIKILGDSADQNYLNGYVLFAFSYFVYEVINTSKKKILNFAALFLLLLFVFATGSRGALLAFLAIIAILLLVKVKGSWKNIIKVSFLILILLIALQIILSLLPKEIAIRFSLEYIENTGTTSRTEIWNALLSRFFNDDLFSIMFGKGLSTTPLYNTYDDHVAHNAFLDILIETGFVGLLFYIILVVSMLKKAWKSENYIFFATLCGFIVMSLSLSLTAYKPIFNAFIIIEITYRTFERNKHGKIKEAI